MGVITKASVAAKFETGDRPTETDFGDLIDSVVFIPAAGAVGFVEIESTASGTTRPGGAVGFAVLAAAGTATAQDAMGLTSGTVGLQILSAETTASASNIVSSGLRSVQVFTADDTWTKPAGITSVRVEVVGGGGGGGDVGGGAGGGGGGGGGCAIELIDVTGTASETITVGAGGTAGAGGNGGIGGTSSFGAFNSATGGAGGELGTNGNTASGGDGGTGSGGDLNIAGNGGGAGFEITANVAEGGHGGGSFFCGGAPGIGDGKTSSPGVNHGGGGGGSAGDATGAAGSAGIVVVWEYA